MAAKKTFGTTRSGRTIDDDLVDELATKAERGYDVDEILRHRGGRPPIGSGPASVESVRLDAELQRALAERAERDQESVSSVIRKALRNYLRSA
jgi:predicted HicB family RNase H-like nuclease